MTDDIEEEIRRETKKMRKMYSAWCMMMARCYSPKNPAYKHYGGRGIEVCQEWKQDYHQFLEDMGFPPTDKHTLDRINNNGNYEPDNCRWATMEEQANNKRSNVWIPYNGETRTMAQWAKHFKIPYKVVSKRLKRGLPLEKVFLKRD